MLNQNLLDQFDMNLEKTLTLLIAEIITGLHLYTGRTTTQH